MPAPATQSTTTTTAEASSAPPPRFKLLERDRLIASRRAKEPLRALQYADIAEIDGRKIARVHAAWTSTGPTPWCRVFDVDEDPESAPYVVPPDVDLMVGGRIDAGGGWGAFHTMAASEETEASRFAAAWPSVAHAIGLDSMNESRRSLFDSGAILVPKLASRRPQPRSFPPDVVRDWVARHRAGDWGLVGQFEPVNLDPVAIWLLFEQGQSVLNSLAIQSHARGGGGGGGGGVISRFELDGPMQAWFPSTPGVRERRAAELITAFTPRGPRSILTVELIQ